ncbi:MAG: DUF4012 domain-containing protein [Candidatus Dojkabacteria bacterium]|nr:MAG: DUF4012 domain-containing protein [Candidatus Dojkabacteria bacterium]
MAKDEFKHVKTSTLISVVIHGANDFGYKLSRTLAEQGSRVIVVDNFNKDSKNWVTKLKRLERCDFVDFQGIEELFTTLGRFDYLFYLQNQYLNNTTEFNSTQFLAESNNLNIVLKNAQKYKAKVSLVTTVHFNKIAIENSFRNKDYHPSPYSAEEIQKYSETVTAEFHDKSKLNVRILRLGALLGDKYHTTEDKELSTLIHEGVTKSEIVIQGEGLTNHYLVHPEDAVYGILKLTFTGETNGEVITLAQERPLTTLSIAYKLLELNVSATKIKFAKSKDNDFLFQEIYTPAPFATEYGWSAQRTIDESFTEAIKALYKAENKKWDIEKDREIEIESAAEADKIKTKHTAKVEKTSLGRFFDKILSPFRALFAKIGGNELDVFNFRNIAFFTVGVILLGLVSYFFITPVAVLGIDGYRIARNTKQTYAQIQELDFEGAEETVNSMSNDFERVETSTKRLEWVFIVTRQEELYKNVNQLLFATGYALQGAEDMVSALEPFAMYMKEFEPAVSFGGENRTNPVEYTQYLEQMKENRSKLETASYNLTLASSIVDSLEIQEFPKAIQPRVAELKSMNREASELITPFQKTLIFLPELLGSEGRQRYLILLQNPSELRSTGGWLSSYAILGIENGQVRQLDVDDIYNLDGQLSLADKSYSAPEDMQEALDIDEWSMSTSNWSPHFPTTAENAKFFIQESGKAYEVDGVIALDVTFIQMLLEKWGGIEVQGEDEEVTADNLYSKIFAIHDEFTPGSRQKATFIANLADAVLKKVISSGSDGYRDMSEVFLQALDQKNILITLNNREANQYFSDQGWSGTITEGYVGTPIPVEWNWGANKANLYLEKTHSLNMDIKNEDTVNYTYVLAVKNESEEDKYPEGEYRNWFRVYLPENADVKSVIGFDDDDYTVYLEDRFTVVAGWFTTEIQSTNQVEVNYTLTRDESSTDPFPINIANNSISTEIKLYKQPGIFDDVYQLDVSYPDTWAIIENGDMQEGVSKLSNRYELESDIEVDLLWEYR